MSFANEGTKDIEVHGLHWHEVTDFSGVVIGEFSNWANALGAQRVANIRKMIIRKEAEELGRSTLFSCEVQFSSGSPITAYAVYDGRWFGPDPSREKAILKAEANGVEILRS